MGSTRVQRGAPAMEPSGSVANTAVPSKRVDGSAAGAGAAASWSSAASSSVDAEGCTSFASRCGAAGPGLSLRALVRHPPPIGAGAAARSRASAASDCAGAATIKSSSTTMCRSSPRCSGEAESLSVRPCHGDTLNRVSLRCFSRALGIAAAAVLPYESRCDEKWAAEPCWWLVADLGFAFSALAAAWQSVLLTAGVAEPCVTYPG